MEQQTVKPKVKISSRGGARVGAGRKALSPEQKAARDEELEQTLVDELIFPSICAAFQSDPGKYKERYLTIELSSVQIKEAYGKKGLAEWRSWFSVKKHGGRDRFGNAYGTIWVFNTAKYRVMVAMVKKFGHDMKNLPKDGYPPQPMLDRLHAARMKKARKENADYVPMNEHAPSAVHDFKQMAHDIMN